MGAVLDNNGQEKGGFIHLLCGGFQGISVSL